MEKIGKCAWAMQLPCKPFTARAVGVIWGSKVLLPGRNPDKKKPRSMAGWIGRNSIWSD